MRITEQDRKEKEYQRELIISHKDIEYQKFELNSAKTLTCMIITMNYFVI